MDKERRNPLNLLNKKNYYNTINLQIENLRDLVELQVERCFNLSKLSSLMSEKQFKNLKRVDHWLWRFLLRGGFNASCVSTSQ